MLSVLYFLILACIFAFFYGLFLTVFKRGRRKRGSKILVGSIVVFIGAVIFSGSALDRERAEELGFESAAAMRDAKAAGITDPDDWNTFLEEQQRAAERAEQERLAEEARQEQELRRKGFHCLSGWDGSHTTFKRAVREAMRNPSSFEHVETRITPVDENGQHTLIMTYRAENGFGGMNVGEARAIIQNDTCNATILTIE